MTRFQCWSVQVKRIHFFKMTFSSWNSLQIKSTELDTLALTNSLNQLEAESVKEFIWLGWGRRTLFRGSFTVRCHVLFLNSLGQRSQRAMAWSHMLAGLLDSVWLKCEGRSSKSPVTVNDAQSWEMFLFVAVLNMYIDCTFAISLL